jgi:hypothetical protein
MQTFSGIIDAFGGPIPYGKAVGIPEFHARTMKSRDSIPPGYWPRVVDAAKESGVQGITFETLAKIAKSKMDEANHAKREAAQ